MRVWPKGFAHGEYKQCKNATERNRLRAKFGMPALRPYNTTGLVNTKMRTAALLPANNGVRREPSVATHRGGRWPRTNEGAIKFIRDWNGCEDGPEFQNKFDLDRVGFLACSARAKSLRAGRDGFKLKMKRHILPGMRILYDWKMLAAVAAETAGV